MLRNAILAAAAVLVACGSSPGTGSGTLWVDAVVETDGTAGGTWSLVQVRVGGDSGTVVDDATVTLGTGAGEKMSLPWVGTSVFGEPAGAYFDSDFAWDPGYTIRVERGEDFLEARIRAPGFTVITAPTPGSRFRISAGEPLLVRWDDEQGRKSDEVELSLRRAGYERIVPEDLGRHEIQPSLLEVHDEERLNVVRTTTLDLAGGVAGSELVARSIAKPVEFVVE